MNLLPVQMGISIYVDFPMAHILYQHQNSDLLQAQAALGHLKPLPIMEMLILISQWFNHKSAFHQVKAHGGLLSTDDSGNYNYTYQTNSGTAIGQWEYYAVDDATDVHSNSVYFTITDPYVAVFPISGVRGTTFNETGYGFTPNNTVTLQFIDPNGPHYSDQTAYTDASGNYTHTYTSHSGTSVGLWEYYAVDDATGTQSDSVYFNIY
ncbi:MAG: hypothetical protein U9N83_03875 [Thermodesulfobacteriota bacterium]|nr:hypothetical protein [Thermodesulfobacteriota bacterium]